MKKTMSVLTIALMCLVGTYASAGTAREDTVKRLQSSVDVLQSIMATPDKGVPGRSFEQCEMHSGGA